MIRKKKVLGVILARGGSKGIKKKNIKLIDGYPLISYSIYAAKKSKFIDEIIVSTDNKEIANISENFGATIPFLRPKRLSGDKVPSIDALKHAVLTYEKKRKTKFDFIIELPCVAPMRNGTHIDQALEKLFKEKIDSVTSFVNTGEKHPTRLKRIKKDKISDFCKEYPEKNQISRRQDFEPCFIRNGAIYAMKRSCITKYNNRHGNNNVPLIMNEIDSINIDSKYDLVIANLLIKNGLCKNNPSDIQSIKKKTYKNKLKPKLLVSCETNFSNVIENNLKSRFQVTFERSLLKKQIKKILKDKDAWICAPTPKYKIDKDLIKNCNNLKIICTPSTGTNHIDLNTCKKNNIKIFSLRNSKIINKIHASSEFTFTMLLSFTKKIFLAKKITEKKLWRNAANENLLRSREVFGKTVGIIGFGRIGKNISKYAKCFSMNVLVYDPFVKIKKNYVKQIKNYSNLVKDSDFLFICVHLNNKTKNMVDKRWFKMMKKDAVLVNSSRGEIINEKDLLNALKSNRIAGAIVDVIKDEHKSNFDKNKMINYAKQNDNLIITPHIAGLTIDSEEKALNQSVNNLIKFLS